MDKRRINVRAIIWKGNKLLAVKHKTAVGGEATYWALPGGGLDPLESLEDGIKREILEETGIEATVGRLLFGLQMQAQHHNYNEHLEFFFHITNPEDFNSIDLSASTHGAAELARCEFIDPTKEHILPTFLQTIDIKKHIDNVLPVHIVNNLEEILE